MKRTFNLIVLILLVSTTLRADVYMKTIYHFEDRYHHGSYQAGYDLVYEWWIGDEKITLIRQEYRNYEDALLASAMRITLDKKQQRMIIVNNSDSSYFEFKLPMNLPSILDSALLEAIKNYQINGTVQETGEKKTIDQKLCHVYHAIEAIFYGNEQFYDRERKLMVTQDVPFNWQLVDELFQWMRSFYNPTSAYLTDLNKVEGFIYAAEDIRYSRGSKLNSSWKTLEIIQKDPPKNIYEIPHDFTRLEKLNRDYIIELRGIIYQMGG